MTDLKKLRELAEKATFDASIWESEEEAPKAWKDNSVNNAAWCRAANPETVIALIDKIEKLKYVAETYGYHLEDCQTLYAYDDDEDSKCNCGFVQTCKDAEVNHE